MQLVKAAVQVTYRVEVGDDDVPPTQDQCAMAVREAMGPDHRGRLADMVCEQYLVDAGEPAPERCRVTHLLVREAKTK